MTRYLGEEALVAYSNRFDTMQNEFLRAVDAFGLPFAPDADDAAARRDGRVAKLASRGIVLQNDAKSAYHKWISLACLACRTGERTESFITSMQCPHNCFFCFNPNQPNYEYYRTHVNPLVDDLQRRYDEGAVYDCLAVTGGEPLLHLDETLAFLELARSLYPDAHLRLYTSGHGFDESIAQRLVDAGLDEIRFSIKLEEGPELLDATYEALETAVGLIDSTMVETPVFPDKLEFMKELLVRLDDLGVRGINLLELGFPFHNADEFARRGYLLNPIPIACSTDTGTGADFPWQAAKTSPSTCWTSSPVRSFPWACITVRWKIASRARCIARTRKQQHAFPCARSRNAISSSNRPRCSARPSTWWKRSSSNSVCTTSATSSMATPVSLSFRSRLPRG